MKNLILKSIHPIIGGGVIADHWFGVSEAGNIAIAVLWILILFSLLVVAIGDNDVFKKNKQAVFSKYVNRTLFVGNIVILFAAGWFVSGFSFLLCWAAVWIKRFNAENEDAKPT